ncbi:MAG: DUF2007 domain-containing protein [Anaerolineae bacterium]|nr:DUF2007 domain-containing protein [Anaerolineae bacterium]
MDQQSQIKYKVVYYANGLLEAETIKLFLASQGIEAVAYQESAGVTMGLTIGPLGEARVLVPETQEAAALSLLKEMENGKFITEENDKDLPDAADEN